jgi:hypothetical protein
MKQRVPALRIEVPFASAERQNPATHLIYFKLTGKSETFNLVLITNQELPI